MRAMSLTANAERLIEYFMPKKTRELYAELKESKSTLRLGELVDVGIVTLRARTIFSIYRLQMRND
jgi:hypothetical protein